MSLSRGAVQKGDDMLSIRSNVAWKVGAVCALLIGMAAACGDDSVSGPEPTPDAATPLKIGLLLHFSEGSVELAVAWRRAFDLAIKHINGGGGVFGRPVEVLVEDSTLDPVADVARRMIEVEGVHVIVGPITSADALLVAEQVTGSAGIPTISPSATSPRLAEAADHDFLFRTALSDNAQGPVLARVTRERGFTNVGLVYRDDAWGQGLSRSFEEAWTGPLQAAAIDPGQTTFLPQLRQTAGEEAQALVVITFEAEAVTLIREAIENGLYDKFTFGDALKSLELVRAIGGEHLGGMYGTAGATAPDNAASAAWDSAYIAEYGELPVFVYVKEAYDATVALALAAQAAGSVDGAAIRDRLRAIGGEPGEVVIAGPEGVASALRILAEGGEVDYEGAAVTLDWDENGDLSRGHIGVWRFTEDEQIEDLEAVAFEY